MGRKGEVKRPLVIGVTGASGAIYAMRVIQFLNAAQMPCHLIVSPTGAQVMEQELGIRIQPEQPDVTALGVDPGVIEAYDYRDMSAPAASGTFRSAGMVVVPCSTSTLGAIASGTSDNLIRRAADVMLKERRRLVLVLRESPLSLVHIENCLRVTRAGACVLPASPGFYHGATSVDDLVHQVVTKILDQMGIESDLIDRWGEASRGVERRRR